ncbi:MAG TPA: biopolymer transporter ExbD [Candidatus Obscuribacterales bacterium]
MRFRQQRPSGIPEINLIPMLNVMMGILAFFALITMSLTAQQAVEVPLPSNLAAGRPPTEPLLVEMDAQGQFMANRDRIRSQGELERLTMRYLDESPDGQVVFHAHDQLPYSDVLTTLEALKVIGGDRVSLAID